MPFHKLDVYRKAYQLSLHLHRITLRFPRFEQYEIGQQLRRCTKSICANIGEGMGRQTSPNDVIHFLRNALGSCDETRIWLEYARDLGYLEVGEFDQFHAGSVEIGKMLNGLISKWKTKAGSPR